MSSSDPNSKIDFLDPPEAVRRKIKNAWCEEGNVTENGVLSFVEAVLIPISQLRLERAQGLTGADAEEGAGATGDQTTFAAPGAPDGTVFSIVRKDEHGGPLHYASFAALKDDFAARRVHPKDLKTTVADAIVRLLDPIRKAFEADEEWLKVEKLAYPDPNAKPEKKKKVCAGTAAFSRVWCAKMVFCSLRCTTPLHLGRARTRSQPRIPWLRPRRIRPWRDPIRRQKPPSSRKGHEDEDVLGLQLY